MSLRMARRRDYEGPYGLFACRLFAESPSNPLCGSRLVFTHWLLATFFTCGLFAETPRILACALVFAPIFA